jgi:hypothetical protein
MRDILLCRFVFQGINHWAHVGAIGTGLPIGFLLGYEERKRGSPLHKIPATGCLLVKVVIVLLWAVISVFYYHVFA